MLYFSVLGYVQATGRPSQFTCFCEDFCFSVIQKQTLRDDVDNFQSIMEINKLRDNHTRIELRIG